MAKKNLNHKYLISLYSRVDEFLDNEEINYDDISDSIVSFCTVVEKLLKIKLHNKNPLLIFEPIRDDNMISVIALKKENDIETVKLKTLIDRFKIVFKKTFTPDEFQALLDIYSVRNCFMHGYKADDKVKFDPEDLIKKMGTVWEKVAVIAASLLGKENIKKAKPKKKYTEKELEEVLEAEVRKMIKSMRSPFRAITSARTFASLNYSPFTSVNECPRCGSYSFSPPEDKNDIFSTTYRVNWNFNDLSSEIGSNLFKCKTCNLELTEKQYEIAKKILSESR